MQCIIDEVLQSSDNSGIARYNATDVRAHFLDDNEPVTVEVIEQYVSWLFYR